MRVMTTAVILEEGEIARLQRVIDSGDGEEALLFVLDVLQDKVKAKELPHCVPFFDAGYNPGQADSFSEGRKRCRKG